MTFDPVENPSYTEEQRLEVLRDSIPYQDIRNSFDVLVDLVKKFGIQPASYNNEQPATSIIRGVKIHNGWHGAGVLFSGTVHHHLLEQIYSKENNHKDNGIIPTGIFGWMEVNQEGWLSLNISGYKKPVEKEIES